MNRRPTFAEIDLSKLTDNFALARQILPADTDVIPVVKADAYGHGSIDCALHLERIGAKFFAVSIPEEGVELRTAGLSSPILVMGGFWPGQESALMEHGLTPAISDPVAIDRLIDLGYTGDVHLKIDTGMARAGFRWDAADLIAEKLIKQRGINVTGAMTHFASADNPLDDSITSLQIERFESALAVLQSFWIDPAMIHLANSPAAIRRHDTHARAVRIGGGLYGLLDDIIPDETIAQQLEPVMTLKSSVTLVKDLIPGESVGYNCTYRTDRRRLTATIPIGYADGLPRALSNKGHFVIRGQRANIIGRVSMDWTVVDVTDISGVSVGDEVIIFGDRTTGALTACEIGAMCGTIGYEITCGISKRVPRVFING